MAMYKNIVAVMAKMSSLVTPFIFSVLSYLILFTNDPCFLVVPSPCVYLSQNYLMYAFKKNLSHIIVLLNYSSPYIL
jgi:hypothetical protein